MVLFTSSLLALAWAAAVSAFRFFMLTRLVSWLPHRGAPSVPLCLSLLPTLLGSHVVLSSDLSLRVNQWLVGCVF